MSWPPAPPAHRQCSASPSDAAIARRSRLDRAAGYALFAVLIGLLGVAAAVLVAPSLIDDLRPVRPVLMIAGLLATVGAVFWLWWRPR